MLVPVQIRKSEIHGSGVFAIDTINRGTPIWEYTIGLDQVLYPFDLHDSRVRDYARERGFVNPDYPDEIVVCCDEAQFLNFPSDGEPPNTHLGEIRNGQYLLLAAVDIETGTEITVPAESDLDYARKTSRA